MAARSRSICNEKLTGGSTFAAQCTQNASQHNTAALYQQLWTNQQTRYINNTQGNGREGHVKLRKVGVRLIIDWPIEHKLWWHWSWRLGGPWRCVFAVVVMSATVMLLAVLWASAVSVSGGCCRWASAWQWRSSTALGSLAALGGAISW